MSGRPDERPSAAFVAALILAVGCIGLASARLAPALAAPPQSASLQADTPRNGNIWDGKAHQPSPATVESSEERAAETTPGQERHYDDELGQLNRQIKQLEESYPPGFLNAKP